MELGPAVSGPVAELPRGGLRLHRLQGASLWFKSVSFSFFCQVGDGVSPGAMYICVGRFASFSLFWSWALRLFLLLASCARVSRPGAIDAIAESLASDAGESPSCPSLSSVHLFGGGAHPRNVDRSSVDHGPSRSSCVDCLPSADWSFGSVVCFCLDRLVSWVRELPLCGRNSSFAFAPLCWLFLGIWPFVVIRFVQLHAPTAGGQWIGAPLQHRSVR